MPPKKKEEQIDLSTLPECVSTNGMLFCLGRKQRSLKIINQILAHNKPFITQITRHQVLDHAKQKNLYIDPATLTDKQKKDAKFMETICTELTPEVFAKAVKSLIEQLSIKIRLQLKLHNEKPQQQRPKFLQQKKLDQLFLIPTDFCISTKQYEALAAINQGVKYIMILNPIISWMSAPQIEQQEPLQEGQQEDEEIKEFKLLKQKEELTEDDKNHQTQVSEQIEQIKAYRKESNLESSFRDCIIDMIQCEIDPYNEEQSINEAVNIFNKRLGKLYVEYDEFMEWRKDKVKIDIMTQPQIEKQPQQVDQPNQKKKVQSALNGVTTVEILNNFIDSLFGQSTQNEQEDDGIQSLINDFDFGQEQTQKNKQNDQESFPVRRNKKLQFYSQNDDSILFKDNQAILQEKSRNCLQYPGIHRYLMPDIPLKSEPLRKLERSYYSQYLNEDLPVEELQRRFALMKFQEIIKEMDEDRKYILTDRVFEQHHDEKSLMRQLYRALLIYDDSHFLTRYSEEDDKLYLALVYKNNQRRLHSKQWESGWKVLPNYESWLKYFKENEQNMNTNSFYDIDYQKIGNINQKVRAFSVPDNGVIVKKQSIIAGELNKFLYGIKNHHLFGLIQDNKKNGIFYSQNKKTKINHFTVQKQGQQSEYETQIIVDENMMIRLQPKTGDVIVEVKGQDRRMYTPSGYTVISGQQAGNTYKILHPTGGISVPNSYINERGFGLKNNIIHSVPTLLRRQEEEGFTIIKRDDNTVTVEEKSKNWIRFEDGTEYLVTDSQTQIQKASFPFIKCSSNRIQVEINDLVIVGVPEQSDDPSYQFQLIFNDGNTITINGSEVKVTETLSQIPYIVDLKAQIMKVEFDSQMLEVSFNHEKYVKNGRVFDPTQNEQNYSEEQTLPQDHVQPKLFIISPNGHGVEYLSQHQLAYYFANKQNQNSKNHLIKEIPNDHLSSNLHIISKIPAQHQLNPKRINLDKNINLDIFKSEKYFIPRVLVEKFTVRSLIKHKNLLPEDQQLINDIKQKKQEWLKKIKKEENEFGHIPRGDQVVEEIKRDKLLTIEFRKKNLPEVDLQELREEAVSKWKSRENERLTLVAQQEEEDKIKMKLGKRIQKVAGDYLPLAVSRKEEVEEKKYFVTPSDCYTHYFQTTEGKKALSEMPDWVFRPKSAKVKRELDPEIVSEINRTMNQTKKQMPDEQLQQQQRYDTVDVNLKPVKQIYIKPSVFTQRQIDQEREAFEQQKKAYFYHQKKRKDFNLYGEERKQKVQVKSMLRTQPISEINQKYLITEAPLDKRIKISSMKNKLTSQASTLIEMRKQGPHQTLLRTLDKRNDYNTLLEKRTMMVHADLNDKLQRDILITPVEVQFGYLKEGKWYEFKINVKNEDILAQRLVVKRARNINVKVMMSEMGPIALGMSRKIIVQIHASPEFMGRFTDEFEIVSKHEIYKIPIRAQIISESQFEKDGIKLSANVREIQEGLKRKTSGLPPIN